MPTREQLIDALRQADAAGDTEAAQRFAALIKQGEPQEEKTQGESKTMNFINSVLPGPARAAVQAGTALFGREKVEGVERAVADGAMLGFGDESEAVLESMFTDKTYTQARDIIRAKKKEFAEENPKTALAANVAGGALTGGYGLGRNIAANAGKSALAKVGSTALEGAIFGGVAGAGSSEAELVGEDKEYGEFAGDVGSGAAVGLAVGTLAGSANAYMSSKAAKSEHLKNILENKPDSRTAKYMVDGAGKLSKDKVATQAIKQGFDEGVVSVMKGAQKQDRANMRKMVNIMISNKRNPKNAIRNRPADVIGQSVVKRYKYVENQKKLAGQAVDQAAQSLKGKAVDYAPVVDDFIETLNDSGVTISTNGGVKLDFDGSDFEGMKGVQKVISRVVDRMSNTRAPDAYDIHRLKRYIDNSVDYQRSKGGSTGQAERIVKGLRANMDQLLDRQFDAYDIANTRYAKSINALDQIDSLLGKNGASDRTVGTLARRISSNAMSGGRVDDAIVNLDNVAGELGGKFSDDMDSLIIFSNELERRLGTSARTSLQGQAENAIEKGFTRAAMDKAAEGVNKIIGVNDDNALIALRRLLTREN